MYKTSSACCFLTSRVIRGISVGLEATAMHFIEVSLNCFTADTGADEMRREEHVYEIEANEQTSSRKTTS